MKCLFNLLLLLFAVASAVGQSNIERQLIKHEDARRIVQQLLTSQEKKDQAWGAWLAGKYRLEEFVPALTDLLPAQIPRRFSEDDWLTRAVWDALIQLDADVSAARIMPLSGWFTDEVIILLSKSSDKHQRELFSLLEEELTDEQWLAICNFLVELKSPKLAALFLRDLNIQASIHIVQNQNIGWGGNGGTGSGVVCGWGQIPKGFPLPVFYDLDATPQRGNVLLARGRHPIYYSRQEIKIDANGQYGGSRNLTNGDRNEYRVDYLLDLLNASHEAMNFRHNLSFTIVWKSTLAYQREVARIRKELNQSWQAVVEGLIHRELLSADEAATLKPNISFTISDHREDQRIKLPEP